MSSTFAPFRIDAPGIDCLVIHSPDLTHNGESVRGMVTHAYDYTRYIVLREYDERVLLHECLHRIIQTDPVLGWQGERSIGYDDEEQLVRRIEKALWAMGWRLPESPVPAEKETR